MVEPATLALLALGGAAILGGKKVKVRKPDRTFFGEPGEVDRDAVADFVKSSALYVSDKYNTMRPLWKFMLATAWRESRFNPYAQAGNQRNSARGIFQMRADSAFTKDNGLIELRNRPDLLLDPVWNFVVAVDYAARGIMKANKRGYEPDVLAIRRYWRIPNNVDDVHETSKDSRVSRERLIPSLEAVGLPIETMYEKMSLGGYPGIYYIGKDFGLWS